jgi:hypothetical protein
LTGGCSSETQKRTLQKVFGLTLDEAVSFEDPCDLPIDLFNETEDSAEDIYITGPED